MTNHYLNDPKSDLAREKRKIQEKQAAKEKEVIPKRIVAGKKWADGIMSKI